MAVAGQMIVSDRRPFTVEVDANSAVPDLSVVTAVYFYVLRGTGQTQQWSCFVTSQTSTALIASYAPQQGDNDTVGETIHLRPYLVVPSSPDVPCGGFEIQVVAR